MPAIGRVGPLCCGQITKWEMARTGAGRFRPERRVYRAESAAYVQNRVYAKLLNETESPDTEQSRRGRRMGIRLTARRLLFSYVAVMTLLAVAHYAHPGSRLWTANVMDLLAMAAMLAGALVHRPARRAPWLLLAAANLAALRRRHRRRRRCLRAQVPADHRRAADLHPLPGGRARPARVGRRAGAGRRPRHDRLVPRRHARRAAPAADLAAAAPVGDVPGGRPARGDNARAPARARHAARPVRRAADPRRARAGRLRRRLRGLSTWWGTRAAGQQARRSTSAGWFATSAGAPPRCTRP